MRGPTRSLSRLCGWPSRPRLHLPIHLVLALILAAPVAAAQDLSVRHPIAHIEARLLQEPLVILDMEQARPLIAGDRSAKVLLGGGEQGDEPIYAKWKPVGRGGQGFNNEPRYDIAAYRFQTLFLDEPDYVVPPTAVRVVPLREYPESGRAIRATFPGADAILVVLQLWLREVTSSGTWDERRLLSDSVYARHVANTNILTYLIQHGDANVGNFLISLDPDHPRVFSVDNGIAFSSPPNPAAHEWRDLRVSRLPAGTVERLRAIRPGDVEAALGVVVQLRVRDGGLILVEPGPNFDPRRAVRTRDDDIQLGLTAREIRGVQQRLAALLRDVDRGRIGTF